MLFDIIRSNSLAHRSERTPNTTEMGYLADDISLKDTFYFAKH